MHAAHMRAVCTDVMLLYIHQSCHLNVGSALNILSMQCSATDMKKPVTEHFLTIVT